MRVTGIATAVMVLGGTLWGCSDAGRESSQVNSGQSAAAQVSPATATGSSTAQPSPTVPPGGANISDTKGIQSASVPNTSSGAKVNGISDVCGLISNQELQSTQNDPVVDAKSSQQDAGAFAVSQCYYSLKTPSKSVSLQITRGKIGGPSNGVRTYWDAHFKSVSKNQDQDEAEGSKATGREGRKGEEEEERAKAQSVSGIGDDAYWVRAGYMSALYVLKNDAFVRISLGGTDASATKLEKSKSLATKVLSRL